MTTLILASQSPRRKEILAKCGYPFEVIVADIDETMNPSHSLEEEIKTLAYKKAQAVYETHQDNVVIGADTVVALNGKILGKPKDEEDAKEMLRSLAGKTHQVYTGVAILSSNLSFNDVSISDVTFQELSEEEIETYVASKEPLDKAGAYGIQGAAGKFITSINGDYYSIMGLPLNMLYSQLKHFSID